MFFVRKSILGILFFSLGSFIEITASEVKPSLSKIIIQEIKESASIFALTAFGSMAYGVLNDQVTARICLEYFTKGFHEAMMMGWTGPLLGTVKKWLIAYQSSATIVGILWGVVATFVIAIIAAIIVTIVSRLGNWPKLIASDLKYPLVGAMAVTGIGAFAAGIKGYKLAMTYGVASRWANANVVNLVGWQTCAYAHSAAYLVGPVAIVTLCGWILYRRYSLSRKLKKEEVLYI